MTWQDEDAWFRHDKRGELSPSHYLYWLANIMVAAIVIFAVADLLVSWEQGHPVIRIIPFVAALMVWLIGQALRSQVE